MRVRIDIIRRPVGGPPRVPDAHHPDGRGIPDVVQQIRDFPLFLLYSYAGFSIVNGHTGAVIATVFQALQALDEDGKRLLASHISDNSTHASKLRVFSD